MSLNGINFELILFDFYNFEIHPLLLIYILIKIIYISHIFFMGLFCEYLILESFL